MDAREYNANDFRALRDALADLQNRYDQLNQRSDSIFALLDHGPAALYLKEPGPGGRFLYLNKSCETAFAIQSANALGKTDSELWPPDIAPQFERLDAAVLETGRTSDGVIVLEREDGTHLWLSWRFPVRSASGQLLIGGYSVERSSASESLEHHVVCQARPPLMGGIYGEEERIVDANDVFLSMLGFTRDELAAGKLSLDSITAPASSLTCEAIRCGIGNSGAIGLREVDLLRKDGTNIPVGIGGAALGRDPRFTWVMYVVDMAEQRRAERRMGRDEAWERLGLMAAGLAHDFNNLLAVIIGNASMAASEPSLSEKARTYLRETLSAAEQAASLVRQMLIYSGKSRIAASRVPIGDIVREMAYESVPQRVSLALDIQEDLPAVTGDAPQLSEALRNLVVNAVEAVGESGAVRICARACRLERPDTYPDTVVAPGNYVCLSVEDTGPGIDEKKQARIFDPFFTTKFHGRGLGLAAAYGIVRRHGGGIHIESAPGKGTRFDVLLKAAED